MAKWVTGEPPKKEGRYIAKMFDFLHEVYRQGFIDGANSDVDPSIHYMAIKRGVRYECGCCGAELILDENETE